MDYQAGSPIPLCVSTKDFLLIRIASFNCIYTISVSGVTVNRANAVLVFLLAGRVVSMVSLIWLEIHGRLHTDVILGQVVRK